MTVLEGLKLVLLCLAVGPLGFPSPSLPVTQAPQNNRPFFSPYQQVRGPAAGACAGPYLLWCEGPSLSSEMGRMGGR